MYLPEGHIHAIEVQVCSSLANVFEAFLKLLQTEGPIVHILYDECCRLIRSVLRNADYGDQRS